MADSDQRPVPDPTVLTTEQLLREVAAVKELMETQLDAQDRRVTEGDERLTDHIKQQVGQLASNLEAAQREVQLALEASEKLELNRIEHIEQRIEAVRREVTLIQESATAAVEKAEKATANQMEEVRRSSDLQFSELRRVVADLSEKVGKLV